MFARYASGFVLLLGVMPFGLCGQEIAPSGAAVPSETELLQQIDAGVKVTARRYLNTSQHSHWQVFHGLLALSDQMQLHDGGPDGELVNALDYVCGGGRMRNQPLFVSSPGGLTVASGRGVQGHPDQFLGYMAQCGLPIDTTIMADGQPQRLADLLVALQQNCRLNQEASWTLVALTHYLPEVKEWTNRYGEKITFEDLLAREASASINGAACGGCHRLMGLAYAVKSRQARGLAIVGPWKEAQERLIEHERLARQYQNSDGTLSTRFFRGPGQSTKLTPVLTSTGHTLEWLAYWLPPERLREAWVERATYKLASLLADSAKESITCGALYHATHAVVLVRQRWPQPAKPQPPVTAAKSSE